MAKERPVLSSALHIAICTFASRLTGLLRDMLLVHAFGLSWVQDAFNYAFQVPNLFRRLFGEGALAAVFVPTFTRSLERDGKPAAWRLLAGALALLTVTLVVLTLVIEGVILVLWLATTGGGGEAAAARELLLSLTALMMPFMIGICVVALFASALNAVGSFVPAALAPIVLNVFMIAGVLWVGPTLGGPRPAQQVHWVAGAVLVASVVQLVYLWPVLRRNGIAVGWRWAPRDPQVAQAVRLMGPVLLGQGVLALGVFLDAQICTLFTHVEGASPTANWFGLTFAYPLQEGALSTLTVAARLYQFPLGVLVVSLGTAALPAFTRLAAREQWGEWGGEVRAALRMAVFMGLLAGTAMLLMPEALIRLLFEYGEFNAADTARAGRVLAVYGVAMAAFFAQHIVLRVFYSLSDVRTPLWISCLLLPVNLAVSLTLIWQPAIREMAFAISSVVTATLSVVIGLVVLERRTPGALVNRRLAWGLARMVVTSAVAGAALVGVRQVGVPVLEEHVAGVIVRRVLETCGSLGVLMVVYVLVARMLNLPEGHAFVRRVLRRGRR